MTALINAIENEISYGERTTEQELIIATLFYKQVALLGLSEVLTKLAFLTSLSGRAWQRVADELKHQRNLKNKPMP